MNVGLNGCFREKENEGKKKEEEKRRRKVDRVKWAYHYA